MLRPARHGHGRGGAGGCAGAFLLLFFALLTMSTRRYDESLQRGVRARKKQRKCVFLNMFRIYGGQGGGKKWGSHVAMKLAQSHGLQLDDITPKAGLKVLKSDVEDYISTLTKPPTPPPPKTTISQPPPSLSEELGGTHGGGGSLGGSQTSLQLKGFNLNRSTLNSQAALSQGQSSLMAGGGSISNAAVDGYLTNEERLLITTNEAEDFVPEPHEEEEPEPHEEEDEGEPDENQEATEAEHAEGDSGRPEDPAVEDEEEIKGQDQIKSRAEESEKKPQSAQGGGGEKEERIMEGEYKVTKSGNSTITTHNTTSSTPIKSRMFIGPEGKQYPLAGVSEWRGVPCPVKNSVYKGTVIAKNTAGVYVDIGFSNDGFAPYSVVCPGLTAQEARLRIRMGERLMCIVTRVRHERYDINISDLNPNISSRVPEQDKPSGEVDKGEFEKFQKPVDRGPRRPFYGSGTPAGQDNKIAQGSSRPHYRQRFSRRSPTENNHYTPPYPPRTPPFFPPPPPPIHPVPPELQRQQIHGGVL
ncbi:hypothetical protein AAMO2058_001375200 [Amorphochlora amoebiformis]